MSEQRHAVFITTVLLTVSLVPSGLQSQVSREWITETTVTFGRRGPDAPNDSFLANTLLIGDIGLRWPDPTGRSFGFSLAGGYDVPNEAGLVGARGRAAREWGPHRLEGSLALLYSSAGAGSLGAVLGAAYYPVPSMAFTAQVDMLPKTASASAGLRWAEGAGVVTWAVAGALGLLAALWVAGS